MNREIYEYMSSIYGKVMYKAILFNLYSNKSLSEISSKYNLDICDIINNTNLFLREKKDIFVKVKEKRH